MTTLGESTSGGGAEIGRQEWEDRVLENLMARMKEQASV